MIGDVNSSLDGLVDNVARLAQFEPDNNLSLGLRKGSDGDDDGTDQC